MSARLVTITTFQRFDEAHLAKGALASAGIEAVVVHENAAAIERGHVVRLQVREEDAEEADMILNQMHGVDHAEFVRPSDLDETAPPARCEHCGSPDVRRVNKIVQFCAATALVLIIFGYFQQTVWAFYLIVVIGVLILLRGRWACARCGHRW